MHLSGTVKIKGNMKTLGDNHLSQQLSIIEAHRGSTSFGISSRWFMNPTAPITYKYSKQNCCSYTQS